MADHRFTESIRQDIRLLFPDLRRHAGTGLAILAAIGVAAATVLLFGWGLKNLVDEGFADQSGHYLNSALLLLLGVILVLAGASYARFLLVYRLAERLTADLRKRLYRHLLALDPRALEGHKTGDLVARLTADASILQMVMATNIPIGARHLLTVTGGIIMLFVVSPAMTGLVLCVIPVVVGPIIYVGRKVRARARDTQGRVGDASAFAQETLSGLETVQSFGYEPQAAGAFDTLADDAFRAAMRHVKLRAGLVAFVISMVFGAIGVVLWMGGHRVIAGQITAGELSAFIFYSVTTAAAVGSLSEALAALTQAAGAADRIAMLLRTEPTLTPGTQTLPETISGAVDFDKVSFRYPSRPERTALENVSFSAAPGSVTALVGPSGAGKSTLFALLQRFYDPESGAIFLDGRSLADLDPQAVRAHISVVAQDPAIFSLSIADNIRIGKPGATDEEVTRAAQLAQAHDFISALPGGYLTQAGERGARLSGGQKQRIAIARALLKDPKILLLDEATSALDSSNEQAVMLALQTLMKNRTTLVIAHRLSTVRGADKIVVMDEGGVVAEGTHDTLYGKNGLYTHLAALQLNA